MEDISSDKTATALAEQIDVTLKKFYVMPDALVAQTYDGANVMAGSIGGTQAIIKQKYKNAVFIHCRAHVLNLVLLHSCLNYPNGRKFFNTLSSLASFFTQSPKRDFELQKFIQVKIPNVCKVKWAYTSRMVNVIENNYADITSCLGEMYLGENSWDGETSSMARGLHGFMLEFSTVFYLKVFASIFVFTDILYQILQTKALNFIDCKRSINETKTKIVELRTEKTFKFLFEKCVEITGCTGNKQQEKYAKIYFDLIDRIYSELDTRFADLCGLQYVALLDSTKFKRYVESFPKENSDDFCRRFNEIDKNKLINELKVLYAKSECQEKTLQEIVRWIVDEELADVFSEVTQLAKIVLTLPSTTASVERTFSAMRRIKNYLRSTMGEERLQGLMLMAVEKEILHKLMQCNSFYDNVIDCFATRSNRRIPLMFK